MGISSALGVSTSLFNTASGIRRDFSQIQSSWHKQQFCAFGLILKSPVHHSVIIRTWQLFCAPAPKICASASQLWQVDIYSTVGVLSM